MDISRVNQSCLGNFTHTLTDEVTHKLVDNLVIVWADVISRKPECSHLGFWKEGNITHMWQ